MSQQSPYFHLVEAYPELLTFLIELGGDNWDRRPRYQHFALGEVLASRLSNTGEVLTYEWEGDEDHHFERILFLDEEKLDAAHALSRVAFRWLGPELEWSRDFIGGYPDFQVGKTKVWFCKNERKLTCSSTQYYNYYSSPFARTGVESLLRKNLLKGRFLLKGSFEHHIPIPFDQLGVKEMRFEGRIRFMGELHNFTWYLEQTHFQINEQVSPQLVEEIRHLIEGEMNLMYPNYAISYSGGIDQEKFYLDMVKQDAEYQFREFYFDE